VKKLSLYIVFILAVLKLQGQDIVLEVDYPSVVQAGQQFSVSWTVNSGGGEFSAPSFEGFYRLMGPQTSYSSSTQIINGKISHQTTYSYLYYLQALTEGQFVIPPASYTYKNKTYYSDSLRIEVAGGRASVQSGQAGANAGAETKAEVTGSDLFVDLSLNRKEVYIGEHIAATVKIYTRVDLSGINEIKYPPFTGFL
jgi:hypothetical protein